MAKEEETTQEVDVEETEAASTEETEETETDSIDYEAELKAEKERREKAEQAAADAAFKLREKKRKDKDEPEEEDEEDIKDKPLTGKQLQAILAKEREQTRKELLSEAIKDKALKLASSESEANLIVEIHKNRTWPESVPLEEQLEEAQAIANRKKLKVQNEELKRALRGKEGTTDTAADTHRDAPKGSEPKMSAADVKAIKSAGFDWDGSSRLYVKKLNGGKKLVYDPKTKQRRVIDK